MKRKTIISAITLCTCILLTACGKEPTPQDVSKTDTDTSTSTNTPINTVTSTNTEISKPDTSGGESRPIIPINYESNFYSIDIVISNQVDKDEYEHFAEMYRGTADFNIVNFVKYFDYPKELFASIVEQYNLEWYDADVIYSDDEERIARFFRIGDYMADTKYADYVGLDHSKYKPNGNLPSISEAVPEDYCGHSRNYHNIPSFLYESVDDEKNQNYKADREGYICRINLPDYLTYMDISREDYIELINKYIPSDSTDSDRLKEREELLADAEFIYDFVEKIRELNESDMPHADWEEKSRIYNQIHDQYFSQNRCSYEPAENEKEPTKNFFVIHSALLHRMSFKSYYPYLECVYGTKYDNIKNYIEYFYFDRSEFEEIMKEAGASDFYDIDDLFF